MPFDDGPTAASAHRRQGGMTVQRFRLLVQEGPNAPLVWQSTGTACSIGSHPSNDLGLEDPTVSRFHCELAVGPRGIAVKDLGSANGTSLDGVGVVEAFPRVGSLLRLGDSVVRFELDNERSNTIETSSSTRFGSLVGVSLGMRSVFSQLERAAATDISVLLEGETGTGKEGAAFGVHAASGRRDRPFVIVDCGALPANLLESELFGHERGAFTGAEARRIGAFEEADGGTVFLDEIGELPVELQPKLLRVLEAREIRRVGTNSRRPVNIRVVAATNRDLRIAANAGTFRSDLYFRIAVLRVRLPPLRTRPEDLPLLAAQLLDAIGASPEDARALLTPQLHAAMGRCAWPGNVRELRNYLERCLLFRGAFPLEEGRASSPSSVVIDPAIPYPEARRQHLEVFERLYVEALLRAHQGKVGAAAEAAGVDRAYLYRLMRRYQLKP